MATFPDQRLIQTESVSALRIGRAADNSLALVSTSGGVPAVTQVGVPTVPLAFFMLNSPAAADADYFVTTAQTGTDAKTYTLATTLMPGVATASGISYRISRNVTVTLGGAKTVTVTVTGFDTQGRKQTEAIACTASGLTVGAVAFREILSVSTNASATDVTITIGFGNVFGLPWPYNSNVGNLADVRYNAAGTLWPNTPLASGGVSGGGASQFDNIPLQALRQADGVTAIGSAGASALGLVTGVAGTATPSVQSNDMKQASGSRTARYTQYQLPSNYIPGSPIILRANAAISATAAVSSVIDMSAWVGGSGSDLVSTNATAITTTAGNKDFVVTPTGRVPGEWLDILYTITVDDTAGSATAKIGLIYKLTAIPTVVASSISINATFTAGSTNGLVANNADRLGTVLIGSDNTSSGSNVPDGTASFDVIWPCVWPQGVDGTVDIGQGTQEDYVWPY